jgi:hypothetical protein
VLAACADPVQNDDGQTSAALEVVQSVQHSPFMERSLVRNLVPLIAIGGSLSGQTLEDRLEYQHGFWNDSGISSMAT